MTSARLIETAIEHFGRSGFEGASTRDIAAASGAAMSSITYHFGGKQGLYLAVADHIAAAIAERQAPALEAARQSATASPAQATELLLAMLESFAKMMLSPESASWSNFICREQQQPTEAFERLYSGAMKDLVETFVALVRAVRTDLSEREVRAAAILLYGQALILRVGLASVCRVLDTETIDADTQALLLARLRAHTLCILSENEK